MKAEAILGLSLILNLENDDEPLTRDLYRDLFG